jgi:profilin
MQVIVASFKPVAEGQIKDVQSKGLYVGGEKYVVLRSDESSLYGRKVSP